MKKIITTLVVTAGLFLSSGVAHADGTWDRYLGALSAQGTVLGEDDALLAGLAVCVDILSGTTESEELAALTKGFPSADARTILGAAEKYLCPAAGHSSGHAPVSAGVGGRIG